MNILHVSVHLGDGIGKAVAGMSCYSSGGYNHKILLLQQPQKRRYVDECEGRGVEVIISEGKSIYGELIKQADIIVINWWHHPVMAEFLAKFPETPCRIVLWSHVNGCHFPYLPYAFVKCADYFMVTSRYSWENPFWTPEQKNEILQKSSLVYGMGDFAPETVKHKTDFSQVSDRFTIGYIGTLNYAKLHPRYLDYCREVIRLVPNCRFVLAGQTDEHLLEDVKKSGLQDYFEFIGYIDDVYSTLRSFDVFGYLLNPNTYATTENSVLEALACAVPTVMAREGIGPYLLVDGVSGYLADDAEHYGSIMYRLSRDKKLRERFGMNGRNYAVEQYSYSVNEKKFIDICNKLIKTLKQEHKFSSVYGGDPWEWFKMALAPEELSAFLRGDEAPPRITQASYMTETKGSAVNFANTYTYDDTLRRFVEWKNAVKG